MLRRDPIIEEEVLKVLKCINIDKCPGHDQMHPGILREARVKIVRPLVDTSVSLIPTDEMLVD